MISRRAGPAHVTRLRWSFVLFVWTSACGGHEVPLQVLTGVLDLRSTPIRPRQIVAVRAAGEVAAVDHGDPIERFVLAVPPNDTYTLEAFDLTGARLIVGNVNYTICGVGPPHDVDLVGPRIDCGAAAKCREATDRYSECQATTRACASLATDIHDCYSRRQLACEPFQTRLDECRRSCPDAQCQQPPDQNTCAIIERDLVACQASFGCEELEQDYLARCLGVCDAERAEMEAACSPPNGTGSTRPGDPSLSDGTTCSAAASDIRIGCPETAR